MIGDDKVAEIRERTDIVQLIGEYVVLKRAGASPNAERRRRLADWLRRDAWEVRDRVSAFAVVAPNPFLRGTITAMRWFFPEKMLYTETWLWKLGFHAKQRWEAKPAALKRKAAPRKKK